MRRVESAYADLAPFHGMTYDKTLASGRQFQEALNHFGQTVYRAAAAGLIDHPRVMAFIGASRTLGDYDGLRALRAGLETGVRRPMTPDELSIAIKIECFASRYRAKHGRLVPRRSHSVS